MGRPALEVADIFRAHGSAWRQAQHAHLSLGQLKIMSAIEQCRSAALGGHVLRCEACAHAEIAYNSCRNRHCPKCQGAAARRWLEARQTELLPVDYYHVVFTLPAPISAIAYTNKAVIYRLLFEVAAETLRTIAADPKHLGAQIGATLVLHTWGSALTHHPHVHGIVPGGGLSPDGERWVACKPGFFLSHYTHRVAISNRRLVALNERGVTFRWKDYRAKGRTRNKTMTLSSDEFMRRFLLHVLPTGFHRIRHYGLIPNAERRYNLQRARELLQVEAPDAQTEPQSDDRPAASC